MAFRAQDIIARKRDGGRLDPEELRFFLRGYTAGEIPDYQAAALLMAVFWRGLDEHELPPWTEAMLRSGDVLDLSEIPGIKVDKHSTGGVGDKISLPLAPLVAACGVPVPMISGRGLGHTGGTLDKLEAIPGFRVGLSVEEFKAQLRRIGVAMIGQTAELAPADKKLYALRDVTSTVESIPLIASSIMSKKLASGTDALVLDVKVGTGAFMKTRERARELAVTMIRIGASFGRRVVALLTTMEEPIGREVGNASEVIESLQVLEGTGPGDTTELVMALGQEMLVLGGVAATTAEAAEQLTLALRSGAARERFGQMIEAQGGDRSVLDTPKKLLPVSGLGLEVTAPSSGYLAALDAEAVGKAAMTLGAGRLKVEDRVDPGVGASVLCKVGDRVEAGQPVVVLWHRGDGREKAAAERVARAIRLADVPPASPGLVLERLDVRS